VSYSQAKSYNSVVIAIFVVDESHIAAVQLALTADVTPQPQVAGAE